MSVEKRIVQIMDCLDRIEMGKYSTLSLPKCADYLSWIYKYHPEKREEVEPLVVKATDLFDHGYL